MMRSHEELRNASDRLSAPRRREAIGSRELQAVCLRGLYSAVLDDEIPEEHLAPLTRYHYAVDAMRDVFDYCSHHGHLYSAGAVRETLGEFLIALESAIQMARTDKLPLGRLPPAGYFCEHSDAPQKSGRSRAQNFRTRYWSLDHQQRLNAPETCSLFLTTELASFRKRMMRHRTRSMFCFEMAVQGLAIVVEHASDDRLVQRHDLERAARRILSAADRLSYTWTLPD